MFLKAPSHRSEAWRRAVASLPCVVCMREGAQAAHPNHRGKGMISVHPWKARFEKQYGTQLELLGRLKVELGYFDKWEAA